ncbi:nuclear transport factor 2 family protein [Streptomyces halobius]|uniref:Nuclear transport factor 2 family protein n=1 Tax=Streptomyces halobius TaxID=2879846 RepID=A0ABY4MMB4_9ACTN|nr:nuclear transport factor 2 family protein [Streptomyces halobius]UQA97556.1 nuclear transport factor 2 family protein [Streptomyces halobius]
MPTDTHTTLDELLQRLGKNDPERMADLYAEHVDWKLSWPEAEQGRSAMPAIRHRSTRADVADHFRSLAEHHIPEEADTRIERILVDGDDAVLQGEIRQTARHTGRRYRARFALHRTVEHGLITRHHVYEDSLAVAGAFDPEVKA